MTRTRQALGLDDFMNHRPSEGGRTNYLRGWKKNRPPEVDVWLHTRAGFFALWQHNIPLVQSWDDKNGGGRRSAVWGKSFNCHESEDVLKEQYFTDRETDERVAPPEVCPVCKLREHVRQLVRDGALTIVDTVFNFDAGDSDDANDERYRVVTAGGIINAFRNDKMTDEEKRMVKDARIRIAGNDGAWRDNMAAKCNYLFAVVDHGHPENGVQVAIEGTSLGNAMKTAIAKEIKRLVANRRPKEEGNPLLYPYAFRWMYDANEKNPGKQYDAMALDLELDDEIRRMIVDDEPPDLERLTRAGDVRALRSQWENAAAIELPFDELFAAAEAVQAADPEADDSFNYGANAAEGEGGDAEPAAPPAAAERPPAQRGPAKPQGRTPEVGRQPARAPAAAPAGRAAAPAARGQAKPADEPPPRQEPAPRAPAARAPAKPAGNGQAPGHARAPAAGKPAPSPAKPAARAPAKPPAKPAPKPEPPPADAIPCDNCQHPMAPDELKCPKCGAEYEDQPDAAAAQGETVPGPDAPSDDEWTPADGNTTGEDGDEIPWS